MFVSYVSEKDAVLLVTDDGHGLGVAMNEISVLSGVGKGAMVMKVEADANIIGCAIATAKRDVIKVVTEKDKTLELTYQGLEGSRADKGHAIVKRDRFARVVPDDLFVPQLTPAS